MFFAEQFTAHSTVYDGWHFFQPPFSADVTWYRVVLYISRWKILHSHIKHFSVTRHIITL